MYEHRGDKLIPRRLFARRVLLHLGTALGLTAFSLAVGMAGYMHFEHLPWQDAFLNTAMLMGGMGPVDAPKTDAGKLFAGCYALYAGVIFIISAGVALAPVIHRLMHHFHWRQDG